MIVDGTVIFSKHAVGRFPVEGEVEERFAALREGKELPPIENAQPTGFVGRILGKLRG